MSDDNLIIKLVLIVLGLAAAIYILYILGQIAVYIGAVAVIIGIVILILGRDSDDVAQLGVLLLGGGFLTFIVGSVVTGFFDNNTHGQFLMNFSNGVINTSKDFYDHTLGP